MSFLKNFASSSLVYLVMHIILDLIRRRGTDFTDLVLNAFVFGLLFSLIMLAQSNFGKRKAANQT